MHFQLYDISIYDGFMEWGITHSAEEDMYMRIFVIAFSPWLYCASEHIRDHFKIIL